MHAIRLILNKTNETTASAQYREAHMSLKIHNYMNSCFINTPDTLLFSHQKPYLRASMLT